MLHSEADEWREHLPLSFQSYLYIETQSAGSAVNFPLTGLLSNYHVSSLQAYLTIILLLALHIPQTTLSISGLRVKREQEVHKDSFSCQISQIADMRYSLTLTENLTGSTRVRDKCNEHVRWSTHLCCVEFVARWAMSRDAGRKT